MYVYKKAFTLMFETCKFDEPDYDVQKNLQGIVVDWSDSEHSSIIKALGSDLATKLHYIGPDHINVLLHMFQQNFLLR